MRAALVGVVAPLAPELLPGLRVRRAAVSTRDARFGAAWIELPGVGPGVAYLRRATRAGRAWRVLDLGPPRVGCGLVPDSVLRDLGGSCPPGVG